VAAVEEGEAEDERSLGLRRVLHVGDAGRGLGLVVFALVEAGAVCVEAVGAIERRLGDEEIQQRQQRAGEDGAEIESPLPA